MNPTQAIADLIGVNVRDITGHIGIAPGTCLECDRPAAVYVEATATLLRGSITEDGHYCLDHAADTIGAFEFRDEPFTVDVYAPAHLLTTALAA